MFGHIALKSCFDKTPKGFLGIVIGILILGELLWQIISRSKYLPSHVIIFKINSMIRVIINLYIYVIILDAILTFFPQYRSQEWAKAHSESS
jgi:hypothetical protein